MEKDNEFATLKIPRRIFPDNIRDAIVEIRYESQLPFDILLGMFFNALDETYFYITRPHPPLPNGYARPNQALIQVGVQHIFYNDSVSIQALPNSIVFTCVGGVYIGWDKYFSEIKKTCDALFKDTVSTKIVSFERVGVRYISDYPKRFLDECMKINFTFGLPSIKSDRYLFRTEFTFKGSRIILNLNNKMPVLQHSTELNSSETVPMSSIDIDVINEFKIPVQPDVSCLEQLYSKIDETHYTEKFMFFSMLKEEYLQTLNPEY